MEWSCSTTLSAVLRHIRLLTTVSRVEQCDGKSHHAECCSLLTFMPRSLRCFHLSVQVQNLCLEVWALLTISVPFQQLEKCERTRQEDLEKEMMTHIFVMLLTTTWMFPNYSICKRCLAVLNLPDQEVNLEEEQPSRETTLLRSFYAGGNGQLKWGFVIFCCGKDTVSAHILVDESCQTL